MATRFWVGGTGTWDSTSTTNWAATSGGASGASAPIAGDNITFDGASGGGVVTPNSSIDSIAFGTLTAGAFTGTLAFNTNNPNMSFGIVLFSGSGARTINMGSGTWTITNNTGTVFDCSTTTSLTPTFNNASIVFSGNGNSRIFAGGASQSYGSLTINNNSVSGTVTLNQASTYASITVGSGVTLVPAGSVTSTISGALSITGTSAAPSGLYSSTANATVSVGSASTITWAAIFGITKSGAGSITATNSFDLGRNSSFASITSPTGGGVTGVIGG